VPRSLLALLLLLSPAAWAQLSASGALASAAPPSGTTTVRWPDVAYDPADDVFLGISGAGAIFGQYFTGPGALSGSSFVVNSGTVFGQAPRTAYAPDIGAFLVAWHETIGNDTRIRGRLIRHGKTALTSDFDISPFGTNWEMGAAMAYSTVSKEFLVAWQDRGTSQIRVQRVSNAGAPLGTVTTVETAPYSRDPAVGYDSVTDRFLVAYGGCVGNDDCFIHAQRFQAGTGAPVGAIIVLESAIKAGYIPEVAFNASTGKSLVVWYRVGTATGLYGKLVDASGQAGAVLPIAPGAGSYDANSVAWNPISNTFAVVTHGSTAQDLMVEVSASGVSSHPTVLLYGSAASTGNFNPRVAASTATASWLGVTSNKFATLDAQLVVTATRDPIDAGVLDAGTSDAGIDAGPSADAGAADSGTVPLDAGSTDAGSPDAGARDAGTPRADAGTAMTAVSSCGCTAGFDGGPIFLGLLVLTWRKRRPTPFA
jgi:hypothetical protein